MFALKKNVAEVLLTKISTRHVAKSHRKLYLLALFPVTEASNKRGNAPGLPECLVVGDIPLPRTQALPGGSLMLF